MDGFQNHNEARKLVTENCTRKVMQRGRKQFQIEQPERPTKQSCTIKKIVKTLIKNTENC